ncbi:MAG: hypothetical protein P8Y71_30550 [Pseudolabrys sp.]|jgi:hypothetical protein
MSKHPVPPSPSAAPRQLSLVLDSVTLRGISLAEREAVLARLTGLLLEAAGVAIREQDDDER